MALQPSEPKHAGCIAGGSLQQAFSPYQKVEFRPLGNLIKDDRNGSGNDASVGISLGASSDSESLSRACLTICKDGAVEALQSSQHHIPSHPLEHLPSSVCCCSFMTGRQCLVLAQSLISLVTIVAVTCQLQT